MTEADTYGALLEREVPPLADGPLYRLVHDDLSEHLHAGWFADFAEHAARHGLGYVGEADLFGLRTEMLPAEVEPELWQLAGGDRIAFENYSDLLTARHFRQSVLCPPARAGRASSRRLSWPNGCTGPRCRTPSRSRSACWPTRSRSSSRAASARSASRSCASGSAPTPGELAEALLDGFRRERLMPHAGPFAPRPSRASARWRRGWRAGRPPVTGAHVARLHGDPHGGAGRPAADHAAGRHARPEAIRAELQARTGLELTEHDLDNNLLELTKLFLLES